MKSSIFALSLLGLAAAQPRGHARHAHKRDVVVTDVEIVTVHAGPDVLVYVDQNGVAYSTVYPGATAAPAVASAAPVAPAVNKAAAATAAAVAAPAAQHNAAPAAAAAPAVGAGSFSAGAGVRGIAYSPYYGSAGLCKNQEQVNADVAQFGAYNIVRSYGTDCGQAGTILSAAKAHGMKVWMGVYDIKNVDAETDRIIAAAGGDWSHVFCVSVGNEVVNNGEWPASDVVSAVAAARSKLRAAGFNGPVLTVDTFVAMIAHPELCAGSDIAAANAHSFFDSQVTPALAGPWVAAKMAAVKAACGGKETWISESGWPSAGNCNGDACPTPENQKTAMGSIAAAVKSNIVMFSAFNDPWKQSNPGTFNSEPFWGFL